MVMDDKYLREKTEYTGIHPQKFALWLAMASMTMFFAALTSALIVKKGDFQNWESFRLPRIFGLSTLIVIGISLFLQLSLIHYRKASFSRFRLYLGVSLALAVAFISSQLLGWNILTDMGLPLAGNIAGSFIYLITSAHGFHLVVGMAVLLLYYIQAIRSRKDELYELRNIINPRRQLHLELLVSFWHYIDAVWIYLYIFFYINY